MWVFDHMAIGNMVSQYLIQLYTVYCQCVTTFSEDTQTYHAPIPTLTLTTWHRHPALIGCTYAARQNPR